MTFIRSISINTAKAHPFPYNIPAVRHAKHINLDQAVTILVGDNGCGKSTLLETIGLFMNLPLIGGYSKTSSSFEAARILKPFVDIEWRRSTQTGFFFRAEDFSDFLKSADRDRDRIRNDISDLEGRVSEQTIKEMSNGSMNYGLNHMYREYGADMEGFSHGEAYLKILETRIGNKGVFLLDEPEAALSPLKQLSLIFLIMQKLEQPHTQFIISTHSPLLMGIPHAVLYEIDAHAITRTPYDETEHYRITKQFLQNPQYYLRLYEK